MYFSSLRSLSPAGSSQRSHRPKLPSIDNDDWEEGNDHHGKSRSRNAATKRANPSNRPPRGQKQTSRNYGSTNQREQIQAKSRDRSKKHDAHLDTTRKIKNGRKKIDYSDSESDSESDSDDSCISSDFTR